MRMYEPTDIPKSYVVLDCETTGLTPETYILTAVGIGRSLGDVEVSHIESDNDETELIRWVEEKLASYDTRNVVCWNAKFDFRFIRTRAMIQGMADPLRDFEMIDDMIWFNKFTAVGSDSYAFLEHVARTLGIGTKKSKGHEMPKLYYEKKYDQIVEHCRKDVELTIKVHERILETEGKKGSNPIEISSEEEIPEISA